MLLGIYNPPERVAAIKALTELQAWPKEKFAQSEIPPDRRGPFTGSVSIRGYCPFALAPRMSAMRDALKLSSEPESDVPDVAAPNRPGVFRQIAILFGFGLLNSKIMVYALGTFLFGLGAGISIDSIVRTGSAPADWLAWSGIALAILGNVIGNLAHNYLKKEARLKLKSDEP